MTSYRQFLKTPNKWLNDERGQKLHDPGIKKAFGLRPEQKWPDEGMDPVLIGNIGVWVVSKYYARQTKLTHRVRASCPCCSKVFSAGKIHQHFPKCVSLYEHPEVMEPGRA